MKIILAFHIIAMVCWFAGLFYLPRLFVYHSANVDQPTSVYFKKMEYRLYYFITMPSAILTTLLGIWLLWLRPELFRQHWMQLKLLLCVGLWGYHLYCARLVFYFQKDCNPFSQRFYRIFNEIPTILLISIVILAIVHPL